jgi:hypothetical protein
LKLSDAATLEFDHVRPIRSSVNTPEKCGRDAGLQKLVQLHNRPNRNSVGVYNSWTQKIRILSIAVIIKSTIWPSAVQPTKTTAAQPYTLPSAVVLHPQVPP